MRELIELRSNPELKIILNTDTFEIVDASYPKNNGTYLFGELKKIELNKDQTDWFISILSFFVDIFIDGNLGKTFKDKPNIKLILTDRTLIVWLIDVDFKKAKRVLEHIKNKKERS